MSEANIVNSNEVTKTEVFSGRKFGVWVLFVGIVSALPILLNLSLDYVGDMSGKFQWRGVRLMDFLTCGFCLIGGAFCDRFNADKTPSPFTFALGFIIGASALSLYFFIKYTYAPADELNYFPNDDKLVMLVMGSYVSALILSAFMLRKTLVENKVFSKKKKIRDFLSKWF